MSRRLISRSQDLQRLQNEGYELEIREGHLVVGHVPYRTGDGEVAFGSLVSTLMLAADATVRPDTHVVYFAGSTPHDHAGAPLHRIIASSSRQHLAEGVTVDHTFSSKPMDGYADYYEKVTTYVAILGGPAQAIDPTATAQTFRVIAEPDPDSPFEYVDTATSRAGVGVASAKLRVGKVAIVGLGGSGSYVLDLLAKVPITEIHVFDGDVLLQHNAFRAPGAVPISVLAAPPNKAAYFKALYSEIKRGIVAHEHHVNATNVELLREMNFVFISVDDGEARKLIATALQQFGVPFIDVGVGVYESDGSIGGQVRVTLSTDGASAVDRGRLSNGGPDPDNVYGQNVQIGDLNALSAVLAVMRWKRLMGFYVDLEHEQFSVYEIDGNNIINEDHA
jgi:hypothetical protein